MSRWRPPSPKSSPYITRGGYQAMERELTELWDKRGEVTRAVTAAAAEGDRSENAEYIYRKKQLREIDARIRYLQKRMPDLRIIDQVGDHSRVFFGASITLEDEEGEEQVYRIVGPDEIDPEKYHISIDSPLARALLGKSQDEEITVKTEEKTRTFFILLIEYETGF